MIWPDEAFCLMHGVHEGSGCRFVCIPRRDAAPRGNISLSDELESQKRVPKKGSKRKVKQPSAVPANDASPLA